jgi:hypothetical protein
MPPRKVFQPRPGIEPLVAEGPAHQALTVHLNALRDAEGPRPTADDTNLRGSMANNCERAVAFSILGVPETNGVETGTLVAFDVGRSYHEVIQAALVASFGAELEVVCSYKPKHDLSGHADAVYETTGGRVLVEIKSMKSYAYGLAVGGNKYDNYGPGPKPEHLMQAGLYADPLNCDWVHMIYVNKDNGEIAEWLLSAHEDLTHLPYRTTISQLAREELHRLTTINDMVLAGFLPARQVPGFGLVVGDPPESGSKTLPWNCRYCGWRDACASVPAEITPLQETPWHAPSSTTS